MSNAPNMLHDGVTHKKNTPITWPLEGQKIGVVHFMDNSVCFFKFKKLILAVQTIGVSALKIKLSPGYWKRQKLKSGCGTNLERYFDL
jgi:hypothetical protein